MAAWELVNFQLISAALAKRGSRIEAPAMAPACRLVNFSMIDVPLCWRGG